MGLQPPPGHLVFHRERHLKFPVAFPVSHGKNGGTKHRSHHPDDAPQGNRRGWSGNGLRRNRHNPRLRKRGENCGLCGDCYRCRFPRQQRIDTHFGGQGKGDKQPHQCSAPKRQKGFLWQAVDCQRAQHGNDQNHRRTADAHLQQAHTRHLIPNPRQSVSASQFVQQKASSCPEAPQTICQQNRHRPC